jgi:D-proline reductase (dithiol) PrdB
MCNQAVSLVSAEIERAGIPTVTIALLREIAVAVRPPRALFVPFRHGFPLGRPGDARLQRSVLTAALGLLERRDLAPPALVDYAPVEE